MKHPSKMRPSAVFILLAGQCCQLFDCFGLKCVVSLCASMCAGCLFFRVSSVVSPPCPPKVCLPSCRRSCLARSLPPGSSSLMARMASINVACYRISRLSDCFADGNNEDVSWTITATPGSKHVLLRFVRFDTEQYFVCVCSICVCLLSFPVARALMV